jgi:hypothetical protein
MDIQKLNPKLQAILWPLITEALDAAGAVVQTMHVHRPKLSQRPAIETLERTMSAVINAWNNALGVPGALVADLPGYTGVTPEHVSSGWDWTREMSWPMFADAVFSVIDTLDEYPDAPGHVDAMDAPEAYERGRNEHTAYIVACMIAQRTRRGCGTSDVIEAAFMDKGNLHRREDLLRFVNGEPPRRPRDGAVFLVHSSHGDLWLDADGYVVDADYASDTDDLRNIVRCDVTEFLRWCRIHEPDRLGVQDVTEVDILELGVWERRDDALVYDEPEYGFRDGSDQRERDAALADAPREADIAQVATEHFGGMPMLQPSSDPATVLRRLYRGMLELGFDDPEAPCNGGDAVEFLAELYPRIKAAVAGAP